jgi:hypothetical protein
MKKTITRTVVERSAPPPEARPGKGHALFPRDEDDPTPRDIEWIEVRRTAPSGVKESCARMFSADELPDASALYERFGGGNYELIARTHGKTRIADRTSLVLAGPSRPLFEVPDAPAPAAAPPPVYAHAPQPSSDAGMGGIFQMMMQHSANESRASREFAGALVQASQANANALVQSMGHLSVALVSGSRATPGEGQAETFTKGLEAGIAAATAGKGGGETEAMIASVAGSFLQGLQNRPPSPPPPALVAPPPPPAPPPPAPSPVPAPNGAPVEPN